MRAGPDRSSGDRCGSRFAFLHAFAQNLLVDPEIKLVVYLEVLLPGDFHPLHAAAVHLAAPDQVRAHDADVAVIVEKSLELLAALRVGTVFHELANKASPKVVGFGSFKSADAAINKARVA